MTEVVKQLLGGLQTSPMLLALISLNVVMVAGAMWFLRALAAAQQHRFDVLMKACLGGMK